MKWGQDLNHTGHEHNNNRYSAASYLNTLNLEENYNSINDYFMRSDFHLQIVPKKSSAKDTYRSTVGYQTRV